MEDQQIIQELQTHLLELKRGKFILFISLKRTFQFEKIEKKIKTFFKTREMHPKSIYETVSI
jgi:hypothetical protein